MLSDNLELISRSAGVLKPSLAETSHLAITEGIIEREEEGALILAPDSGTSNRRVMFVNSYGGRSTWEKIKKGILPSNHLWGCIQLVKLGYEVAIPEPLPHLNLYRRPFPHDFKLFRLARNWLRAGDIIYCGHTLLYWLPLLKMLGALNRHLVSLTYARDDLDFSRAHSGIIALTPAAEDQARKTAPKTKVAHLGWGVDLNFYPELPYDPHFFLSCGITFRDHQTLSTAATQCHQAIRVVCPERPSGVTWPANVEIIESGRGWSVEEKTVSYSALMHDYYTRAAGALIITGRDDEQRGACGFTNLIEAMAVGRPVILTRTGALLTEIDVEREGCGLYVPPEDPAALAEAMDTIMNDRVRAEAMGRAARQRCESHYNIERFATQVHKFFESL